MEKFKLKDFARHKHFGPGVLIQIINIVHYIDHPETMIYTCRYFSNGQFYTADFYEFELNPVKQEMIDKFLNYN